ncbi:MAG: TetR/AcrR family transcriptional regulator [Acidobacteriota bacterium]
MKNDKRLQRKQLRYEQNKTFILQTAEEVFVREGYTQANMDEIAEEAQFSKATLYRYFRSKKELFLEIILSTLNELSQELEIILTKDLTAEDKLKEIISAISLYSYRKKNIARVFFMEKVMFQKHPEIMTPAKHPQLPPKLEEIIRKIAVIIRECISEGITGGEFCEINVEDAAFVLGGMIRGFVFRGPFHEKEYSIEETTELIHSIFLYGISNKNK